MSLALPTDRCFVIAEAGTNHADTDVRERMYRAKDYIKAAKRAGADAIKFQWFAADRLGAIYDPVFCPLSGDDKRMVRWSKSALGREQWRELKRYAEGDGLVFLASTFQHSTVAWLNELGVVATKVASRAADTFPYEKAPKPYIVSLGMTQTIFVPSENHIYLACEARYPSTMIWRGAPCGFSDHSGTPWRAIDAISRGCKLIEVHFHIDERDAGPDLPASLTLDELKLVCEARDAFAELRKCA